MATMLPSIISPEIKSSAERKTFEWFKQAPHTDNWVVLHSLGISNHKRLIYGEIDFFILAPKLGFFALEVKGGRVSRTNGIWSFTDRYGNTNHKARGPFDQAREGIYSIIATLKNRYDFNHKHLEKVLFGFGVMFPDIEYKTESIDEEQFQIFDMHDQCNVRDYIVRLSNEMQMKLKNKFGPHYQIYLPTYEDIKYVKTLLRGDFDRTVSLSVRFNEAEDSLLELTKEQYACLDQLEDNPRCLILGLAGTGKTLLALEATKKAIASGEKVAFFCYNKNLGEWLQNHFNNLPSSLQPAYIGTLHKLMFTVLRKKNISFQESTENTFNSVFYEEELPKTYLKMMSDEEPLYDRIIVDEAQDLISPKYLDVFDLCLKKGLLRGNWSLFGDFTMQAIYAGRLKPQDLKDLLLKRSHFIVFKLSVNCRNTKPIIEELETITELRHKAYSSMNIFGPPVNYITYLSAKEQKIKLNSLIRELLDKKIEKKEITILSPYKRSDSILSTSYNFNILDYNSSQNNEITFCTIHGYKGLENKIIILTDIDSFKNKQLMYIAMSRARSGLYVFESNNACREYTDLQRRRFFPDD